MAISLYEAVDQGMIDRVTELLEDKQLPNTFDSYYLLLTAVYRGFSEIVKKLIEHRAPIAGFEDVTRNTLLHYAVEKKEKNVTLILLNYFSIYDVNANGETPIHVAAKCDNKDIMDLLLRKLSKKRKNVQNIVDRDGLSLFHILCTSQHVQYVANFLKKVPRLESINAAVSRTSKWCPGYTALHFAAACYRHETAKLLLSRGADLKLLTANGSTPLHLACELSYPEWMLNEIQGVSTFPSFFAKLANKLQDRWIMIEMFVEYGSDVDARDNAGNNALMHVAMTTYTINDVYVSANRTEGAHDLANFESVLVSFSAVADEAQLALAKTLLQCYDEHINLDLDSVRDKPMRDINTTNDFGYTYFHFMALAKVANKSLLKLFLNLGIDLNAKDNEGATPLHRAASIGNPLMITYLLEITCTNPNLMINFDVQDDEGNTPLHLVYTQNSALSNHGCFKKLLHSGADISIKNEKGESVLSYATHVIKEIILNSSFSVGVSYYSSTIGKKFLHYNNLDEALRSNVYVGNHVVMVDTMVSNWKQLIKSKMASTSVDPELHELLALMTPKLLVQANSKYDGVQFITICKEEIFRMKMLRLNNYASLYDVLVKPISKVALYCNSFELKKIMKYPELKLKFPIYRMALKTRYARGLALRKILKPAQISFGKLINYSIPDLCIEQILSLVNEKTLLNIIEAGNTCERNKRNRDDDEEDVVVSAPPFKLFKKNV